MTWWSHLGGGGASSYSMVQKWNAEFKRGRVSLEDDTPPLPPPPIVGDESLSPYRRPLSILMTSDGVLHCH